MPGLLHDVDPEGLLEYSVVYTDRALNHMSQSFQGVMRDISVTLKQVYNADAVAIVPGSGTFGMEAVARQFAHNRNALVIRNGWFSYRWHQILEMGRIPAELSVAKARRLDEDNPTSPFAPPPIEDVEKIIERTRPDIVFAPHVETSSGIIIPDDYIKRVADAVHAHGGLMVLDCIASGTIWVDMQATGVDLLISAPQKGWSGSPCCAMVMMSTQARAVIEETTSSSFSADLRKWLSIMETYEAGGHAYHATLPTDGLRRLRDIMQETAEYGFDKVKDEQWALGQGIRQLLKKRGLSSVAAPGFEAPGVVVCYSNDDGIVSRFAAVGLQVAAGVPLMCDEGDDFQSFRVGLFGLDKLHHPTRSIDSFQKALDQVLGA